MLTSSKVSCSQSSGKTRIPAISISISALNIISDILIVSIPTSLLWRVHVSVRQMIGLVTTLCLSTVMAIVSAIRIGGLFFLGSVVDEVWSCFWLQQECSIAVIMVSITASRALFVSGQHHQDVESGSHHWRRYLLKIGLDIHQRIQSFLGRRRGQDYALESPPSSEADMIIRSTYPRIPLATVTGVRTAIDRVERQGDEAR